MREVGTARSPHGPHLVTHSRGENPCTRRYCSCRPRWAGTSPLLQGRLYPPATFLVVPAYPRQVRVATLAAPASDPARPHPCPPRLEVVLRRLLRPGLCPCSSTSARSGRGPDSPLLRLLRPACKRASLLDKIRARGHHRCKSDCCAADPCASPCATAGAPVILPGTTTPPKEMPKPKTTGSKEEETSSAPPLPIPSPLPAVPSLPVAGNGTPY